MKKSQLLRKARKHLPRERYVCYAIQEAAWDEKNYDGNYSLQRTVYDLKDWIQYDLLEEWGSYNQWLEYEKEIPYAVQMKYPEKLLLSRKKWMDWMIKYWEDKGE